MGSICSGTESDLAFGLKKPEKGTDAFDSLANAGWELTLVWS